METRAPMVACGSMGKVGRHGQPWEQQLDGYGALWLTMANVRYGETAIRGFHV